MFTPFAFSVHMGKLTNYYFASVLMLMSLKRVDYERSNTYILFTGKVNPDFDTSALF